ncbi:MAG: MFS transporter [Cytophagales bacterium]|nr:MAG: MFS transporter [Cytophagales bacterium]
MNKHPKGLYLLFVTEMWERFSYYGMKALLVIFVISKITEGGLGWTDAQAGNLWGTYTGLLYLTPIIGGYLADRYFGNRKAILIGGFIMMLGHFALVFNSMIAFYIGLGLLIIGNGFFKPNATSMVGQLYPDGSPLKDSAYIIFHIGINLGSFFGVLLCGFLGENYGWHLGFGTAGVAMALGLLVFYFGQNNLGEIGLFKPKATNEMGIFEKKLTSTETSKLKALAVLALFSIIFWMTYEQGGSSMSIFAKKYTDRFIGGFEVPSSWFQSLNPLFVFTFAPLFAWLWTYLGNKNPNSILKLAIGLGILSSSFIVLYFGAKDIPLGAEVAKVSMFFWIGAIFLQTISELFFYPIGLSLVSSLSPKHLGSIIVGAWLCSFAVGNFLSGVMASMIGEMNLGSFFMIPFYCAFAGSIILFLLYPILKKWIYNS